MPSLPAIRSNAAAVMPYRRNNDWHFILVLGIQTKWAIVRELPMSRGYSPNGPSIGQATIWAHSR